MCEVLARNAGIRRAKGDIIVSTNIDIIALPARTSTYCAPTFFGELMTFAKQDVELDDLRKHFGENNTDVQKHMPLVFGLMAARKAFTTTAPDHDARYAVGVPQRARHAFRELDLRVW